MSLTIKKRGRPSKAEVAARQALPIRYRSDDQVLADLSERFTMLGKLTEGALDGNIRSLVVTGAPGVGKTYTVENILGAAEEGRSQVVKGALSAVNLYRLAWKNRRPGNVVVLDDADSIFQDEDALNLLKALCDSSKVRRVSWMKESVVLKEDDIPQSFEFQGSFIFISNLDFQKYVDMGGNKYVPHFQALMSRSMYLDLTLHDRQAIALWVRYVAKEGKLFLRENVAADAGEKILGFIAREQDNLRELSLRTLTKVIQIHKTHPATWERYAQVLLCRS